VLRFVLRWQHVHPGTQVHGAQGLLEIVSQLQGFHAAAGAWESDLLASRVARYEPGLLDQLCHSGAAAWGRLSCASMEPEARRALPNRATPISIVRREDLPWLLEATGGAPAPLACDSPMPSNARLVGELLARKGALFFHELLRTTGFSASDLEDALWRLVSAGVLTSDGFGSVRFLIAPHRRASAAAHPLSGAGRWSLLRRDDESVPAPPRAAFADSPAWVETLARQYLRRYGLVFRDLLGREARCPPWRELARVYRRMEARGELRGGRFAQAFSGEQFALPEALDALRSVRRTRADGTERVSVCASDPLNLVGIVTPGPRVPASSSARIDFVDGVPQIASEQVALSS
jgi:ATP-dependent Lhr-like helicase